MRSILSFPLRILKKTPNMTEKMVAKIATEIKSSIRTNPFSLRLNEILTLNRQDSENDLHNMGKVYRRQAHESI